MSRLCAARSRRARAARARRVGIGGALSVLAAALGSCDVPPAAGAQGPPVVVASFPEADALDVPRRFVLRLELDRDLDPRSVSRNSVAVVSGDVSVLLTTRYDLVDRAVEARPFRGGPLLGRVRYRVVVEGLRGALGGALVEPITIPFRTAADDNALPVDEEPPTWTEVGPFLRERCGAAGCHGGERPAMGLALDTADGVRSTALGVPSLEARGPREGDESLGVLSGRPGLARIEIIGDEGRPEHSYLLMKVTGHSWISGDRMPLDAPPLEHEEQRLLQRWIRAGAPTGD